MPIGRRHCRQKATLKTSCYLAAGLTALALARTGQAQLTYSNNSATHTSIVTGYSGTLSGTLTIPDSHTVGLVSYHIVGIAAGAFSNQTGLAGLHIGNNVTTVGANSFQGCTSLLGVTFGTSITTLAASCFSGCAHLAAASIPDSVTSIAASAFKSCGLKTLSIGTGVTSIGTSAFDSCGHLTGVTIPDNVQTLGSSAFRDCVALSSVTMGSGVASIAGSTFQGCTALTRMIIPDDVISIGDNSFAGCTSLAILSVGNSVTSIGASAFQDCAIPSVTIPASVTSIGDGAFSQCDSLSNALFLGNAPSIGSGIFANVAPGFIVYHLLGAAGFAGSWPYSSVIFWLTFTTSNDQVTITGYAEGAPTVVNIPATLSSLPVTTIGPSAFADHADLTGVNIPSSVLTIGDEAFVGCTGLTGITIPDSVTSIGVGAFSGCSSLASAIIGAGTTSLGPNAFSQCTALASLTIGASVATMGDHAFDGCTGLTTVTLPTSLNSIGNFGFRSTALKSAIFLGDAPTTGVSVFSSAAQGFAVYYFDGATGFTAPSWTDSSSDVYPAVDMGTFSVIKPWLVSYGFAYNTDLTSDPNEDGVSLLLAYALNLNPTLNLANSVPGPVLLPDQMLIVFYGATPGVTYTVETSTDLKTWSSVGVTLTPYPDKYVAASIPETPPAGFLRLKVSY